MNILVACNDKYLNLAKYMLFSLSCYNDDLNVYLIHEDISDESMIEFTNFFNNHNIGSLNIIKFDSSKIILPLKDDDVTGHITKEAYFRLYAPFFLPDDMERILYLDCDIICTDNISDFYNRDFDDNILVGCLNTDLANSEYIDRLGLPKEHIYINSGVLLFNLKRYKEFTNIDKLNKFILENASLLDFQDQDVVNKMFTGKILVSSIYYNFQIGMLLYTEGGRLIHYTGPIKPWSDEYSRPILAMPYYDVLDKLGEVDKLKLIRDRHIRNFKQHEKSISVVIDGDAINEKMIENILFQLETRVEFIVTYNQIDNELIEKYMNMDSRIEFVKKESLGDYNLTGFYRAYLNIDDFYSMYDNFIREMVYFMDTEKLSVAFYKDFGPCDNKRVLDYGKEINSDDVSKLIAENKVNGYMAIYMSEYNKNKSSKYGYWSE